MLIKLKILNILFWSGIFLFAIESFATSRLITMNVHCLNDNWQYRTEQILNKFLELNPEVIALQEVCKDSQTKENQIDFIYRYLNSRGYPLKALEAQYTHDAWGRYEEYLVLITNKNVSKIEKGYLPISLLQRAYLAFLIEGTWYVNTHLEYRSFDNEVRRQQLAFLVRQFEWWPHVIMGDFNSSPQSYEQGLLHEKGYFPFFPDKTFIGNEGVTSPVTSIYLDPIETRIDGFWFDPKMSARIKNVDGFAFLKERYNGKHLSDHLPVFVNYQWK